MPSVKGLVQARAIARRETLLDATYELLANASPNDISYRDIADHAGVPLSSCYHFFGSKMELLQALFVTGSKKFWEKVFEPYPGDRFDTWEELVGLVVQRAVDYFGEHPVDRRLNLGGHIPAELKLADRLFDKAQALRLYELLDRYFEMPEIPNVEQVFFTAIELVDTVLTISEIEHERITEAAAIEAKRAQVAYLQLYIAPILKRRR